MAMDLEALRREVNSVVGNEEESDFYYFPAQAPISYLQWVFCKESPVAECFDHEKLILMIIPMLEEEAKCMSALITVLKKHIAMAESEADIEALSSPTNGAYPATKASDDSFRRSVMRKFTRQE